MVISSVYPSRFSRLTAIVSLILGLSVLLSGPAGAINEKAGTTAFSFLKLGVGAKAVAMGGAFTAVADDPSTMYYNPAGTVDLTGRHFLAGYHNYVLDVQSGFVAYSQPFLGDKRIGFFIDYLNFGEFTRTNAVGEIIEDDPTFSGSDFMLGVHGSMRILPELSAGINLKFITEYADSNSSEALAADIGLLYRFADSLTSIGVSAYNLGGVISGFSGSLRKDKIPTGVRLGVAHALRELPVVVALDGVVPNDNDPYVNVGLELYELQPLYLRLGYSTFGENYKVGEDNEFLAGFAAGFGLDYKTYHFSYAFVPYLDLGTSHRVTITGRF